MGVSSSKDSMKDKEAKYDEWDHDHKKFKSNGSKASSSKGQGYDRNQNPSRKRRDKKRKPGLEKLKNMKAEIEREVERTNTAQAGRVGDGTRTQISFVCLARRSCRLLPCSWEPWPRTTRRSRSSCKTARRGNRDWIGTAWPRTSSIWCPGHPELAKGDELREMRGKYDERGTELKAQPADKP